MKVPAHESLTVFFDGDEVPGVIFYALAQPGMMKSPVFPVHLWPQGRAKPFRLHGKTWEVQGWDLALRNWPRGRKWADVVQKTFEHFIDCGSVVAWLGAEGCPFSDPPDLFTAESMSGGVLAAMTSERRLICPLDPDLPAKSLSDEELAALRRHAGGLADAASDDLG